MMRRRFSSKFTAEGPLRGLARHIAHTFTLTQAPLLVRVAYLVQVVVTPSRSPVRPFCHFTDCTDSDVVLKLPFTMMLAIP